MRLLVLACLLSSVAYAGEPLKCAPAVRATLKETHGIVPFKVGLGSVSRLRFNYYAAYRSEGTVMVALLEVDPETCAISDFGFVNPYLRE